MPFNVALTGIKAATVDLEVTGNNIANASTVGFKKSRVEFGDLYANSFVSGSNNVGDGVRVQSVTQTFNQGNISFTDNGLDLAINGAGFFILNNAGETRFGRAGNISLDKDGILVNNTGMRLQGFQANEQGNVGGVIGDLVVDSGILAPQRTSDVEANLNLDASEPVLSERGVIVTSAGPDVAIAVAGTANGYTSQTINVTQADGTTATIILPADSSANASASLIGAVSGIDATATSRATLTGAGYNNASGTMRVSVNGVPFDNLTNLTDLTTAINASPALIGVSAIFDGTDMVLVDNRGNDLNLTFSGPAGDGFVVAGNSVPITSQSLNSGNTQATIGGTLSLSVNDGITLASATTDVVDTVTGTPFVNNLFDPLDENSYNHATSTNVIDSLGNPHVLTTFFVKEPQTPTTPSNLWSMYVQIDNRDVGDPITAGGAPTRAQYSLAFNEDGSLNENLSDLVLVSNWLPLDSGGNPNGADGPLNVADGGSLPITDPAQSSNFEVDITAFTQYGSAFSVNDLQQNGFTTGRLAGLDVSDEGVIFARFTNGESQVLGQVALANFNSVQGLSPVGETTWVESFRSGSPVVGTPGSASLGNIRSSSLEESNVELSEQLVNLIIAQRNYQANAKTIETANAITQTIINVR